MGKQVCNGALISCSFGAAPASLSITPENQVNTTSQPAATVMDYIANKNIPPFGQCSSSSNPAVITAYGAPQPCMPQTVQPWEPGIQDIIIKGKITLDDASTCKCLWNGTISVMNPGQETTNVG